MFVQLKSTQGAGVTKFQWNSSNLSNHVRKTHKSIIADPQRAVRACAGVAGQQVMEDTV
jgi:hypothetical protein